MVGAADRFADFDGELNGDGIRGGEDMRAVFWGIGGIFARIFQVGRHDFPTEKAGFGIAGAGLVCCASTAGHFGFVGGGDLVGIAVEADGAGIDPDGAVAQAADLVELVGDEDDGAALAGDIAHFAETFFLEIDIADGEDFVDEEDFGLEMGGDGKGEADVHAGRVVLDGSVDKLFEFGEGDDFVELAGDFGFAHAEDGAGEESIFAAGKLGMEAGADFEEGADASANFGPAGRGASDAGEYLEERGFAGAVASDEAEDFALADVEGDVFECEEGFAALGLKKGKRGTDQPIQGVAQAGLCGQTTAVLLAETFGVNDGRGHGAGSE